MNNNRICKILDIEHPIIMAPMFLVSNVEMIVKALESGISAAFPAMNYRTDDELRNAIAEIKSQSDKTFGINLIVNKSNPKYPRQLEICLEAKVGFIITSLGSPEETIAKAHPAGIKVFCDVTDISYARKVVGLGADAIIAVSAEAGGHAGDISAKDLITELRTNFSIPIIGAGGVANSDNINDMMSYGADAVSVGTVFIAATECPVSEAYKQALIDYKAKDIVRTSNLSGSPLTVINTPYVQEVGTEASWMSKMLYKNKKLKKYLKLLITLRGMHKIQKAAFGASYKSFYVAGPSIEQIHQIRPLKEIVKDLIK